MQIKKEEEKLFKSKREKILMYKAGVGEKVFLN